MNLFGMRIKMKKVTIKEIKRFLKTLEENRYRKLVHADARRIAWFVNNSLSEDFDTMPETMRKKWVKAEYKKERYMAKKFLESMKRNEAVEEKVRQIVRETIKDLMEAKMVQWQIPDSDKKIVMTILKKLKLKSGKDYDFGVGKGATFVLELDKKYENKVLEMLLQKRVRIHGL